MAFVDLETKKIYGTKEGSYTWFHEIGHIKFSESKFGSYFAFWKDQVFIWTILTSAFSLALGGFILKYLPMCFAILFIFMYFFEEAWCWGYSFRIKKGGIKNARRNY